MESYYTDEGIFEYLPNGFALITKQGRSLSVRWQDLARAESGERMLNQHIKIFHVDLYLSQYDFITIDSTMPGFHLFEKRLKENLREHITKATATANGNPAKSAVEIQ